MTDRGEGYRRAGVDLEKAARFTSRIGALAASTYTKDVVEGIGGFAGLIRLPIPVGEGCLLVACADGVGTKILLAEQMGLHQGIGRDLVAMNLNDLICCGARPLAFLDYIATGRLEFSTLEETFEGMTEACREADCALLGGETAEMPGFYPPGRYDLAGFAVGIVKEKAVIDGRSIKPGDQLIGVASSGPHANGFSLIRKILEDASLDLATNYAPMDRPLGEVLLEPTRLYVRLVRRVVHSFPVKGLAHITGGGLLENIPRILPEGCRVVVRPSTWLHPPLFSKLAEWGHLELLEMYRVFNMGIGLVIVVAPEVVGPMMEFFRLDKERAWLIGEVEPGQKEVVISDE